MKTSAFWWLIFNFLSIIVLAFYSMLEMACVSFNKVRLQYYVSKGMTRAIWLNYLLHTPSRLFGTTLIGVNIALVIGSECSREFHQAIGLSPDLAPLSQVILVVIFGELAPMFAARRYAENVAMLGVPLIYASAKLMAPLLWCLGLISRLSNYLVGGTEKQKAIFLSQEELQKILEEQEEDMTPIGGSEEFNAITTNIFHLHAKVAMQVMEPITNIPMIPSNATIEQMQALILKTNADYLPIYHRESTNIVGIAFPRDLIRVQNSKRVRDYARPPWFITQNTKVTQILTQFRRNNQSVAIVLDAKGKTIGIINFYDIMEEIFGKTSLSRKQTAKIPHRLIIERIFPGDMKISEFDKEYNVTLDENGNMTLSDLIIKTLDHHPEVGESIFINPFEITVKEASILEVKTVSVSTRIH